MLLEKVSIHTEILFVHCYKFFLLLLFLFVENCILLPKGINEFVVFLCIAHVWFWFLPFYPYFFHRRMGHGFRFLLPPFLYYPLFQKFHNHSFFKIFRIIPYSSFDNTSRRHTSWIIRVSKNCGHRIHVLFMMVLSNEEKRMIMKILKKEWLWKFWKKGVRRKRNPCPMRLWFWQARRSNLRYTKL